MKYEIETKRRVIRVMPEREEDLYFIYLIIDKGDIIRGWTIRDYKPEGAKEGERVKMFLAIRVEALEYHKFRGSLRARGVVVETQKGIEGVKGRRHTLDITIGREVEIEKEGENALLAAEEVLNMAKNIMPRILLVSIDDEEAAFAHITTLGFEVLHVVSNRERAGESLFEEFIGKVLASLEELRRRLKPDRVVLAGPGIVVEQISRVLKAEVVYQSSGGVAGVYEFLRNGLYDEIKNGMGLNAYGNFLHKLSTNRDGVALGDEVVEALIAGRVDSLLVVDTYIKENPGEAWALIRKAYKTGARVFILREDTEAGAGIKAMGGKAAILRW